MDLLERIKSGRYRAPPVRRAYIPKADGSQRMLGIPTFEDKVAQRAVTMVLEAVYEQDFLPCSYGFRPGRSQSRLSSSFSISCRTMPRLFHAGAKFGAIATARRAACSASASSPFWRHISAKSLK